MAKKKTPLPTEVEAQPLEDQPVQPMKEPSGFVQRGNGEETASAKPRISFAVTPDGRLDVDSLKGKNRQRVTEFLADARNFEALGINRQAQEEEAAFKFTEDDARSALQLLNGTNAWATAFFLKRFKGFEIHPDILGQAFQIPPKSEKELSERGARLMNRYSSEWMRKHADLVFFVLGYLDVVKTQAITAILMQDARNKQMQAQTATGPNGKGAEVQATTI